MTLLKYLLSFIVITTLTACGGAGGSNPEPTPETTPEPTPEPEEFIWNETKLDQAKWG
jgi:hypothetical protein